MPEQTRAADPMATTQRPGLQRTVALARHEVSAATRSRVLVVMTLALSVVSIASVLVAAAEYRSRASRGRTRHGRAADHVSLLVPEQRNHLLGRGWQRRLHTRGRHQQRSRRAATRSVNKDAGGAKVPD